MSELDKETTDQRLDILIHEKIFGHKLEGVGYYGPTKSPTYGEDYKCCDTWEEALELYKKHWPEGRHGMASWKDARKELQQWGKDWGPLDIESYTGWFFHAWELVVKMRSEGWDVTIQNCHSPEFEWCVMVFKNMEKDDDTGGFYEGQGNICLAICQAALKAYGVEVPA